MTPVFRAGMRIVAGTAIVYLTLLSYTSTGAKQSDSSIGRTFTVQEQVATLKGRIDNNEEDIDELKSLHLEKHLGLLDQQVSFIIKLLWACLGTAAATFLAIAGKAILDRRNYHKVHVSLHSIRNTTAMFDERLELNAQQTAVVGQQVKELDSIVNTIKKHCLACPIMPPERPNGAPGKLV